MKAGGGISATTQRSQSHLYTARFQEKPESWSRVGRSCFWTPSGGGD